MSKINLTPNASGTGTLTVTSPNTNSDYTLTLPAVTGTFNTSGAVNEVPAGSNTAPSIYFTGDTNTGIYSPGADTIAFTEGGTEAMRIDSSGNVGIGTTSPSYRLHVYNSAATGTTFKDNIILNVASNGSGADATINFTDSVANNAVISQLSGALIFGAGSGAPERMRIASGGDVLVGTTSTLGGKLSVKTSGSTNAYFTNDTAGGYILECDAASNAGTYYYINFRKTGTGISNITSNGTTISYNTGSDYRLKENIQPITNALQTVAKLKPSTWNWKEFWGGGSSQGFVAHELAEVVPDCVTGEKDAVETYIDEDGVEQTRPRYQGVDTSFLVATLTAAIQELNAKVEAQAAEIAALKAQGTSNA